VFERFPKLKFVFTEGSAAGLVPTIEGLDAVIGRNQKGAIGELKYRPEDQIPKLASEYFARNCWVGASFPSIPDVETRKIMGHDRYMWGSDYPHDEGTLPYTREHLRQVFSGVGEDEMRAILGENAAKLYNFDLEALEPWAEKYGPTVEEIARPLDQLPEHANESLLRVEEWKQRKAPNFAA